MTTTIRTKSAAELNEENRKRRDADDRAHQARLREIRDQGERMRLAPWAMAGRRGPAVAPAPKPPSATTRSISAEIGATIHQRTSDARKLTLEAAVAGDTASIAYLKTEASWFSDSTAHQHRDHRRPPSTDAEIQAAAAAYLKTFYGVTPAAATKPTPKANADGWAAAFRALRPRLGGAA